MTKSCRCTRCGGELPGDAPQGLCPKCLLAAGFATDGQSAADGSSAFDATLDAKCTPPAPAELAPYFPELEIIELLGRGGMGVVYKARQKRLDRLVALKILSPKIGRDPSFAARFAREARAMAMLGHANIVAVHDFGQANDLYYFLMEYVDGVNLRQLLDAGKLAAEEALAIVPQICEALQFAHDRGVVHRDIKPENILLDKRGQVKIADFGIAKLVGTRDSSRYTPCAVSSSFASDGDDGTRRVPAANLTAAGQIVGTPQYMAPEQIESPQEVDHRADIYSLGVVFYQMLTGELPSGRFALPSKKVQIDVRLDEVVLRALEKEPERRYQQASEVKTEVENIAATPREPDESAAEMAASASPTKVSMCYLSTPEHLRSLRGRFLNIYKAKGELRLDGDSLSFRSDWPAVMIPLSSIRKMAQGDYPYSAKPLPIHYIEVTFAENGVERTLLFTPLLMEVMFPDAANKVVAEWLSAIQQAVRACTGRTLSAERSQVAQDKFWLIKTSLAAVAVSIPGFSIIPLILHQRLPNKLSEWLLGPSLMAITTVAVLLAMQWWRRRSGNQHAPGSTSGLPASVSDAGKPTIGKMVVLLTVIAFAIGMFVSIFITYWSVAPPRQEWRATTTTTSPAIDRVLIAGNQATIEGEATTGSRIMFAAGGGYESCGFKKNGRFTATVKAASWRAGLDITVVDADGNRLLTSHTDGLGTAKFSPDRVIFGDTPLKPEPDGSIRIAEVQRENGERLPLTVSLSSRMSSKPTLNPHKAAK